MVSPQPRQHDIILSFSLSVGLLSSNKQGHQQIQINELISINNFDQAPLPTKGQTIAYSEP